MCPNKNNFEGMYKTDLSCSLCKHKTSEETEIHLLQCPFFSKFPELSAEMSNIKYMDIFSVFQNRLELSEYGSQFSKEKLKEQK